MTFLSSLILVSSLQENSVFSEKTINSYFSGKTSLKLTWFDEAI